MKHKYIEGIITQSIFPNQSTLLCEDGLYQIKGGMEGQKVRAKKIRRTKAKLIEVLEPSFLEREAGCPHKDCGGCIYDKMSYEQEVKYKEMLLNRLFQKEGISQEISLVANPCYEKYRNKMEYTFGDEYKGSPLALGLHKKNRFYEIENTDHCQIVHEDFNKIREATRAYFEGTPHYNRMRHEGILRHLVIRRTRMGEILINLVSVHDHQLDLEGYVNTLLELSLEGRIVGILHTLNNSLSDAIIPEEVHLLYGRNYCLEEIHNLSFRIGPFSFFQTNTDSAELLYEIAMDFVENLEGKVVLDLYSGTGTITQIFALEAKQALGIEIVEEAVQAAKENAALNHIENVKFLCGDVLEKLKEISLRPDLVVLDPPREGIHPKAIDNIIDFYPQEFLYISCNPVTFLRDLKIFLERGYELKKICALDQFPRTTHVECVCLMTRER